MNHLGKARATGGRNHRRSLLGHYVWALGALVGGALVVSGLVNAWFAYREQQAALLGIQYEKAAGAAHRIEQFVVDVEHAIRALHTPGLAQRLGPDQRRAEYLGFLRRVPAVADLAYLDGLGREQLRVSRLAVDEVGGGVDRSRDPAFRATRRGETYLGPVYFRFESEPYMTVAVPEVRDAGVTVAEVNLKLIWEVVAGIQLGQAGRAYVVDRLGYLVAHPDLGLVLQKTDFSTVPHVRWALEGRAEGATGSPDLSFTGTDVQGRRVVATGVRIASLGWTVFVEQPIEVVFSPLYASLARAALLLLAGLVACVVASQMLARRLVRPIQELQARAAQFGAGALDQRIQIHTGDELEALADELNHMAERLEQSYATLEQRVEQRTQELTEAVRQIEQQKSELAYWNRTLERQVEQQVGELQHLGRLRRFLSPQVADLVVASGDEAMLESHRREITVAWCALRGFTAFSEAGEPEDVMAVLGEFHAAMGELVFRFGGTVERFAGEALVVLFNGPVPCDDPAPRAVHMALAMRLRVDELVQEWRAKGHEHLSFAGGIALGYATLGRIGFEGRFDYGAIGGVTNAAAALCAHARDGEILVSQRVYPAVHQLVHAEAIAPADAPAAGVPVLPAAYRVLGFKDADGGDADGRAPAALGITSREREVAGLIARGLTNRQIAAELIVSERTVATHIEHILGKLDFASRTQIGVWAAEHGLVAPGGAE